MVQEGIDMNNEELFGVPRFDTLPDEVREISLKAAQRVIERYHYTHRAPVGHRFSLGVYSKRGMMGVMMFGRPVARCEDQESTLELTRMHIFESPEGSPQHALALAETWIRGHKEQFGRLIAYVDMDKDPFAEIFKGTQWQCILVGKVHRDGWASREGRIEDSGGKKLKFERLLNVQKA
jgi:hypothetical protein